MRRHFNFALIYLLTLINAYFFFYYFIGGQKTLFSIMVGIVNQLLLLKILVSFIQDDIRQTPIESE